MAWSRLAGSTQPLELASQAYKLGPMKKLLASFALVATVTMAAELKGVSMPDSFQLDGKTLQLNGLGARLATLFKVKVYVGGLYTEKKLTTMEDVLADAGLKRIHLEFQRDVDGSDIQGAWREYFSKACKGTDCSAVKSAFDKLVAAMGADVTKGQTMTYVFRPAGVSYSVGQVDKGSFGDAAFGKFLIQAWVGPHAPNSELREGMLSAPK
jgi:hypothetical protein